MRVEELLAAVDRAFARRDPDLRPWPDPWPDRKVPESAYSVVSEPDKWRIVGARAVAWSEALEEPGLARREPTGDASGPGSEHVREQAWWLRPVRDGAVPLRVRGGQVRDGLATTLELDLGDPPLVLLEADCFCDACDSGSEDALSEVDRAFLEVVTGDVVLLDLQGSRVRSSSEARESRWGGDRPRLPGEEQLRNDLEAVRAGRPTATGWTRIVHGAAWDEGLVTAPVRDGGDEE